MSARNLAEGATNLIISAIQTNIGSALSGVATYFTGSGPGNGVSLENPREYFFFEKPQGYMLPAVFVIPKDIDFQIDSNKSNFINAKTKYMVSILVEDEDLERLTVKAWRYQSALHSVLDQAVLTSSDNSLQLRVVVYHASFSPTWTKDDGLDGSFRKEVVLECEVTHLENF